MHASAVCGVTPPGRDVSSQQTFLSPNLGPYYSIEQLEEISPPLQVELLVGSGPSANRVDLVFFADGYTADEYAKFINDAMRLAVDVSSNQTFNSVKPLLNFWAAFSPSNESGIGSGGVPKNTPYGLYRDGTELRGVYYSKPEVAHAACMSMGDRCDYPILLGNDPLYGGLGGDFTVITASPANGALVLRHELGHSMIDVGEEYDGGFAYFGVNAAGNASSLPWAYWLSHSTTNYTSPRVERSVMPIQAYPWTILNTSSPWSITFDSSGTYARHLLKFSLSGIPSVDDLSVLFDGVDLGWEPRHDIGLDRWHYDVLTEAGLSAGSHEVSFVLREQSATNLAQLCSVEVLEFGDETEFNATPGNYGIYPTFSESNETSYRPTNRDCLMRAVTTPNLCNVCLEGLWHSLLKRVDLIDDITDGCTRSEGSAEWSRTLELRLLPLAQFRDGGLISGESYSVLWKKDGKLLDEYTNQTRLSLPDGTAQGKYAVEVEFTTKEVRVDTDALLTAKAEHIIDSPCADLQ
ncbi:hypothetical protein FIBSPDRAFT_732610 [Athelia psychrophila]|uniref:IgA peptidase M64 n=1 Tax=Athelia psychrophila TaxID=1759441 RepID=A0A166PQ83_9AGAM|nr:hypothetical protein FIBSPDRAFT_732610 [Fibularhizoctonia sp. CBS 109695]